MKNVKKRVPRKNRSSNMAKDYAKGLFLVFLSLFSISLLPALSEQQFTFCDSHNVSTFSGCIQFWDNVTQILNISNQTILVNVTQNVTQNVTIPDYCSLNNSVVICNISSNFSSELQKIDEYASRGYECVFEGGLCVNFQKIDNVSLNCDDLIQKALIEDKPTETDSNVNSGNSSSGVNAFFYIIIGILALILGYIFFSRKKKQSYSEGTPPEWLKAFMPPKPKEKPEPVFSHTNTEEEDGKDEF